MRAAGVVDRLYNDAASRIEKNMRSQMSIRAMQSQAVEQPDPHTYRPAISEASKAIS